MKDPVPAQAVRADRIAASTRLVGASVGQRHTIHNQNLGQKTGGYDPAFGSVDAPVR